MSTIAASGINVPLRIELDSISDTCIDVREDSAVGERLCLRVHVEGVATSLVQHTNMNGGK